eukprot:TRINITY_DN2219_c0_g1_i2.p1 TRINITY_DN2219_c0_g1~~TRINITY_DN2219_c0_g1_i2.p1  ORF type:complete len:304 (-),score=78.82 TRINITY_DN2219_c0_g1_i2:215-1126(-)
MVSDSGDHAKGKKRKAQYLQHNKPSKKGNYAVRPGVEGFFITCDGGRESQAKYEAINLLDRFYDELLQEKGLKCADQKSGAPPPPRPTRIVFNSDDEGSPSDDNDASDKNANIASGMENDRKREEEEEKSTYSDKSKYGSPENRDKQEEEPEKKECHDHQNGANECGVKEPSLDTNNDTCKSEQLPSEQRNIDSLLEAELGELKKKEKARFLGLDSGCNGVVFVRMRRESQCPGPSELVEYIMNKAASTRKHISRFLLRVLPVEVTCYASVEEIERSIKPFIEQNFPAGENQTSIKVGGLNIV